MKATENTKKYPSIGIRERYTDRQTERKRETERDTQAKKGPTIAPVRCWAYNFSHFVRGVSVFTVIIGGVIFGMSHL